MGGYGREKAMSFILLNLTDEVLFDVTDEENAPKLSSKLERLYMTPCSSHEK